MKYLLCAILGCLLPIAAHATQSYSYQVIVLPPFGQVTINESLACPNPVEHARCVIGNQAVGSFITIKGLKDHACYVGVNQDGSVSVDQSRSIFCTVLTKPATPTSAGQIQLQKHF